MEATTNSSFNNYPTGAKRSLVNLFDHTDAGTAYTYSNYLNGGYSGQMGVAKSYQVYPGDKVKIETYAKYADPSSSGSSNVTAFAAALLGAFGVPAPAGGETGTLASALNQFGSLVAGGGGANNPSGPKAFVNILIFDKDFNFLDIAYEAIDPAAKQVGVSPVVAHDFMMREYTIKEAGYVFMYVSNENPTLLDVYFDDVTMTYTPGRVIQSNEYYPFGLQTSNSWTRTDNKNDYLYNAGSELNQTNGWYEMFYRGYDPTTGRMLQVDPYATMYASHSTYNYSMNNPVMMNDPSGGQSEVPAGTSVSGWNRLQRLQGNDYSFQDYSSWYEDYSGGGGGGSGPYTGFWNNLLTNATPGTYQNDGKGSFMSYSFTINFGSTGEGDVGDNIAMWGEVEVTVSEISYGSEGQQQSGTQGGDLSVSQAGFGNDYLTRLGLMLSATGEIGDQKLHSGSYTKLNGTKGNFNDRPFKRLSQWGKANKNFDQGLSKMGKLANGLVVVTTVYDIFDDGNLKTSTVVNASLTALAIVVPVTAPFILGYAVLDYAFGISEYIDANSSGINTGIYDR